MKDNESFTLQTNKTKYSKNIYWVFGILLKKNSKLSRDDVMRKLLKYRIDTRPFFLSMNKQKIFKKLGYFKNKSMKNSEYLSKNGFYVPSGLGISRSDIKYVCSVINRILN